MNSSKDGMTGKKRDNLVSGCIALVSMFFLIWIIPAYTPPYPGYGISSALLPYVVISIILVLSVLSLVQNLLTYRKENLKKSATIEESLSGGIRQEDRVHLWHLACFMIPCFLLMPFMKWLGFIPGGLLFMMLMQYLCGQRKPVTMVIVAICAVGFSYAAMRYGLGIPMP